MIVLQAISLLLPILLAGIIFILSMKYNWIPQLNRPIDVRLFGENKKWRGVFWYMLGATSFAKMMHLTYLAGADYWMSPVFSQEPIRFGLLTSGAYVAGELVNSLVKRLRRVPVGSPGGLVQKFFDNVDGALGSGLVLFFSYHVDILVLLVALLLSIAVHAATDFWMRRLGLKNK